MFIKIHNTLPLVQTGRVLLRTTFCFFKINSISSKKSTEPMGDSILAPMNKKKLFKKDEKWAVRYTVLMGGADKNYLQVFVEVRPIGS